MSTHPGGVRMGFLSSGGSRPGSMEASLVVPGCPPAHWNLSPMPPAGRDEQIGFFPRPGPDTYGSGKNEAMGESIQLRIARPGSVAWRIRRRWLERPSPARRLPPAPAESAWPKRPRLFAASPAAG